MDNGDIIFTIQKLAEYLKISRSTLYKLSQEGKIPVFAF
ncbi:MAG: DNA-binding protein [Geobacteraceae bacterium]|nr:MAG: DNA-binding protein [Geobacteraceae bacterium]